MMETPGIPLTRWFDAVLLPTDQVDQKDNVRALFVQGHASNSITRIPESMKALPKLDLLVVADPHPTTWASLAVGAGRKDNMYLLPICTQFETSGSRVASNRSIQWGEVIVPPSFEAKDDYQVLYLLAKKLGFADLMFKNIKVEGDRPVPEDVLREINRGSWSTGYTGQSPERLKAHMKNQEKFDLVTLRAPKDDPEVGGDYYGLPWPCWGTPEVRHPGSPILYDADAAVMDGGNGFRARFGVERNGQTLLAEGSYLPGSEIQDGYPEFTMGVFKKLGWDKDLTPAELATIEKVAGSPDHIDTVSWSTDLSGGIQRVRDEAWLFTLRQRQGAHGCLEPTRSHPGTSRADLYTSDRPGLEVSDVARRQAVPSAEYRLLSAKAGRGQRYRQVVPADRLVRSPGRIRRRRRRDPVQSLAR